MHEVENTIPVLPVSDLQRSLRFYTDRLGFTVDWGGDDGSVIGSVSRDGHAIMLSEQGGSIAPGCVWIGLETDRLFDTLLASDIPVVQPPENHPWAYDMKIQDPDGNVLWLGTEPKG